MPEIPQEPMTAEQMANASMYARYDLIGGRDMPRGARDYIARALLRRDAELAAALERVKRTERACDDFIEVGHRRIAELGAELSAALERVRVLSEQLYRYREALAATLCESYLEASKPEHTREYWREEHNDYDRKRADAWAEPFAALHPPSATTGQET